MPYLPSWKVPENFLDQCKQAGIGLSTCSGRLQMILRDCVEVNANGLCYQKCIKCLFPISFQKSLGIRIEINKCKAL